MVGRTLPRLALSSLLAVSAMVACAGDDDEADDDDCSAVDDDSATADDDVVEDPFGSPDTPGPFLVGNTSIYLEDPSRELTCGEGPRTLLTEVWYPASDDSDAEPEHTTRGFFLDRWDDVVAAMGGTGEALIDLPTGSYRDAPLHPGAPPMPITVFSHGYLSSRFQSYTMATYLASHGYLVVAPDHACNTMVTLTPDQVIPGEESDPLGALVDRRADVAFLLDRFIEGPSEPFAGSLDPDRVALWGHSWGGATVTELIKTDDRPQAILQIAAFAFPPMPETVTASSMFWWGQQDKVMGPFLDYHLDIVEQMPPPKHRLEFIDTGHFAFSDLCQFVTDLADENGCGTETVIDSEEEFTNPDHGLLHEAMNAYATAFFGSALFAHPEADAYLAEEHFPELVVMESW